MKFRQAPLALLVLTLAGTAHAQSSVTLFGVVDVGLQFGRGSIANRTQIANSSYTPSRLGFRGVEDLGGGMSASFWLEAGLSPDTGLGQATNSNNQTTGGSQTPGGGQGITFNRRSTVSLAGSVGELRLGRDYTPQFWNLTIFDPFLTSGVGANQAFVGSLGGPTLVRASNSVGYFLPSNLGGIYGQAQLYFGENPSNVANKSDGNGGGVRLGYASGPVNVALAYGNTKYVTGDVRAVSLGGSYDFGVAKVYAMVQRDDVRGAAPDGRGFLLAVSAPVGASELRASYSVIKSTASGEPTSNKLTVGYVYNLSKRTNVYATAARLRNSGGASAALGGAQTAANRSSSGLDLGMRHVF